MSPSSCIQPSGMEDPSRVTSYQPSGVFFPCVTTRRPSVTVVAVGRNVTMLLSNPGALLTGALAPSTGTTRAVGPVGVVGIDGRSTAGDGRSP